MWLVSRQYKYNLICTTLLQISRKLLISKPLALYPIQGEKTMKLFNVSLMTIMAISIVSFQVPSNTEARLLEIADNQNHFKVTYLNKFLSTVPAGHSLDGHKKGIVNVQEKILINIKDFAPTDPGNSPGIGHPKMDVHAPRHNDYFKVARGLKKNDESTKDFALTDPGNSPGIGHPRMDVHAPRLGVISK